jgi:hypothetical protein
MHKPKFLPIFLTISIFENHHPPTTQSTMPTSSDPSTSSARQERTAKRQAVQEAHALANQTRVEAEADAEYEELVQEEAKAANAKAAKTKATKTKATVLLAVAVLSTTAAAAAATDDDEYPMDTSPAEATDPKTAAALKSFDADVNDVLVAPTSDAEYSAEDVQEVDGAGIGWGWLTDAIATPAAAAAAAPAPVASGSAKRKSSDDDDASAAKRKRLDSDVSAATSTRNIFNRRMLRSDVLRRKALFLHPSSGEYRALIDNAATLEKSVNKRLRNHTDVISDWQEANDASDAETRQHEGKFWAALTDRYCEPTKRAVRAAATPPMTKEEREAKKIAAAVARKEAKVKTAAAKESARLANMRTDKEARDVMTSIFSPQGQIPPATLHEAIHDAVHNAVLMCSQPDSDMHSKKVPLPEVTAFATLGKVHPTVYDTMELLRGCIEDYATPDTARHIYGQLLASNVFALNGENVQPTTIDFLLKATFGAASNPYAIGVDREGDGAQWLRVVTAYINAVWGYTVMLHAQTLMQAVTVATADGRPAAIHALVDYLNCGLPFAMCAGKFRALMRYLAANVMDGQMRDRGKQIAVPIAPIPPMVGCVVLFCLDGKNQTDLKRGRPSMGITRTRKTPATAPALPVATMGSPDSPVSVIVANANGFPGVVQGTVAQLAAASPPKTTAQVVATPVTIVD